MPNILILNRNPPSEVGGIERLILDLGRGLNKKGWNICYLTSKPNLKNSGVGELADKNFELEFIDCVPHNLVTSMKYFFSSSSYRKLHEVVKRFNPDLILDNANPLPFYPLYFSKIDVPKCLYIHAIFRNLLFKHKLYKNWIYRLIIYINETLFYRLINVPILVVGFSTYNMCKNIINHSNVHILNPCIDTKKFKPKINKDKTYILCLSRLESRKGIETLLKAWKIARIDIPLKIAGEGPKKNELIKLKKELKLTNVEFLGYVTEEEKIELYSHAYIYVLPTLFEGYGISILEAMASGVPVISTNTHGIRDIIYHGKNGLLVELNNPEELAEKIKFLINNNLLRDKLAKNGLFTAREHDFDRFITNAEKIFRKFLKN